MRVRGAPWPNRRQWRNALVVGTLMLGGGMGGTAHAEVSVGSGLVVAFIAVVPLLRMNIANSECIANLTGTLTTVPSNNSTN